MKPILPGKPRTPGAGYDEEDKFARANARPTGKRDKRCQSKRANERGSNVARAIAHRPTRKPKLGQHFLDDASAARRIVEALGDVS